MELALRSNFQTNNIVARGSLNYLIPSGKHYIGGGSFRKFLGSGFVAAVDKWQVRKFVTKGF